MIKGTLLLNEAAELVNEALSVSIDVRMETNEIMDLIEKSIRYPSTRENYQYVRGECMYEDNLTVKYLIINSKSKKIYEILRDTLNNLPDSYFDYKKPEIFIVLWAVNGKILKNADNYERLLHEVEHYYQYTKQNRYRDIISDRKLYDFVKEEAENKDKNHRLIGTLIYLTEKSEIDALIQQMQANFTDYVDVLDVYPQTMAYKAYHYCKKNLQKMANNSNIMHIIDTFYFPYGLNYTKLIKRIEYGVKYYEVKIGKVLSYFKK